MKLTYTLAALTVTTMAANAAVTATQDVATFDHQYTPSDYGAAPFGVQTATVNTTTGVVDQGGSNNGWLQNTGTDWNTNATAAGWTVELGVTLQASEQFIFWADASDNGTGAMFAFRSTGIDIAGPGNADNAGTSVLTESNVGSNTFRIAYDPGTSTINLWKNGTLVTDTYAPSNPGGGQRLILGDCCSSFTGTTFQLDSVAFTSGAVAPVPEPSSTALLGLGGLALILRRRK